MALRESRLGPVPSLVVVALLFSIASPAGATDRSFTYTYETPVAAPGHAELEPWVTYRTGKDQHFNRYDLRVEYEGGIAPKLQTALYMNFTGISQDTIDEVTGQTVRSQEFALEGVSNEWKYQLSDPVADVLGSALYLEGRFAPAETEVEAKVLLDKRAGSFVTALNFVGAYEWNYESNAGTEKALELAVDAAAGVEASPGLVIGVEVDAPAHIPDEGRSSMVLNAGPSIAGHLESMVARGHVPDAGHRPEKPHLWESEPRRVRALPVPDRLGLPPLRRGSAGPGAGTPCAILSDRRGGLMRFSGISLALLTVVLTGCPRDKQQNNNLSLSEAAQALDEASVAGQAEALTSASVEITTSFTIGDAVQQAAQEIRTFVSSQLPCAEITLADATLTIEYGVNPGNCTYKGHTFSGSQSVTVAKNDQSEVIVTHKWMGLSNGIVKLDGDATVTWNFQEKTRHVVHTADWTRISDSFTVTGSGDRTQTVLEGGLLEGIQVDGSRSWKSSQGQWDLAIDGVQMRWVDAVPQAGSYTLGTPSGKSLSLSFTRVNDNTIRVTVSSGNRAFNFNVTTIGKISNAPDGAA